MEGLNIRTHRPGRVSRQLREGDDPDLTRRQGVVALSFVASGAMPVVALFQGTFAALPLTLPEARRAWREIRES